MLKKIILATLVLFTFQAQAAEPLDTQFTEDGLEAHLLKATVKSDVLTIVVAIDNSAGSEDVESLSMPVSEVFFNTKDKKYPILVDENNKFLASSVSYEKSSKAHVFVAGAPSRVHKYKIKAGKKRIVWMKFEAPTDAEWPLQVNVPGITPFNVEKPQ